MSVLARKDDYHAAPRVAPAAAATLAGNNQFYLEQEVNVSALMQPPMDMLRLQAAERDITLFYEATKIKMEMKIDQEKIRQSVIHVVQNALKFSKPASTVYVTTGRDFNGDFYIRVDDEGVGIGADMLERILEPFTKVENGIESSSHNAGRGLGLVNAYLKMHFGYLRVQSQPNRGTSVTLTLPKSCILTR